MTNPGRCRMVLVAALLAAACAAAGARPTVPDVPDVRDVPDVPEAAATQCEFDQVERIVAVGDVHGAYDRFVEILRTAAVIDAGNKWIGGKTHLVQTGDVVDRGPDSRKVLLFLKQLTRDAERAGGRVHALFGNHEAMRMLRFHDYVVAGEYAAFVDADSVATRRAVLETIPPAKRADEEQRTPLGMIEMMRAFLPSGDLGSYLLTLNAVVKVNGIVFLHGGISPAVAPKTCTEINDTVRREFGRDLEKTRQDSTKSFGYSVDGPLWYRGLALEPDEFAPEVKKILAAQRARAIVIGHSAEPGPIRTRFDNTVFLLDTGMQPAYIPTGRASALEIKGDVFTAIYVDGRQILAGGGK